MSNEHLKHVLDGYTVLDFTQVLAGPTVTRLMAEMGSEIIKVELAPLCRAMGRPELADDARFSSNARRVENMDQVVEVIEGWLASTSSDDEAVRILQEARLPVAPVLSVEQAVKHPHLRYRRTVRTIVDREFGELDIPGMPLKFPAFPDELSLETPSLGEHNEETLSTYLSYTPEQVQTLESEGVLKRAE